jgi:hypothetical protein
VTLAATGSLSLHDFSVTHLSTNGVLITDGSPTTGLRADDDSGTGCLVAGGERRPCVNLVSDHNLGDGVTISAQTGNVTAAIINATIDQTEGTASKSSRA